MQWLLILILIAVCYFFVVARRQGSSRSREGFQEKVLLDELDLGAAAEPTIRDLLMEKAPMFIEDQLEIFKETRSIYERIIRTAAGLLAAEEGVVVTNNGASLQPFVEPAIAAIARDAGETPRFCSKGQLDAALDSPSSAGLERLYECLPATPGKYLLLLSYAARMLKRHFEGVAGLGLGSVPELPMGAEGDMAVAVGASKKVREGWRDSRVSEAFVSAYALKAPERGSGNGSSSGSQVASDPRQQTPNSTFDNQLEAWKQAFDAESTKRIKQYIRYCNNVYKKLDTINEEAESGDLLMRVGKGMSESALAAAAAANAGGSGSLPAMNLPF
jgi:hypothetical protein